MLAAKHAHTSRHTSPAGALPRRSERRSIAALVTTERTEMTARAAVSRRGSLSAAPKAATSIGASDAGAWLGERGGTEELAAGAAERGGAEPECAAGAERGGTDDRVATDGAGLGERCGFADGGDIEGGGLGVRGGVPVPTPRRVPDCASGEGLEPRW